MRLGVFDGLLAGGVTVAFIVGTAALVNRWERALLKQSRCVAPGCPQCGASEVYVAKHPDKAHNQVQCLCGICRCRWSRPLPTRRLRNED